MELKYKNTKVTDDLYSWLWIFFAIKTYMELK